MDTYFLFLIIIPLYGNRGWLCPGLSKCLMNLKLFLCLEHHKMLTGLILPQSSAFLVQTEMTNLMYGNSGLIFAFP